MKKLKKDGHIMDQLLYFNSMKNEKCVAVICRFNEDLDWSNQLLIPRVIYNKGELLGNEYPWAINIENVGRESEAFLSFIIENYNDLPQRTVFLQGDPFYHFKALYEFLSKPNKNHVCFMSDFNPICDEFGRPHHFEQLPLKQVLSDLNIENEKNMFHFSAGAQYLVPRKFILSKSLIWWKKALEIHNYYKSGPWIFERIWPLIWNYEEKI